MTYDVMIHTMETSNSIGYINAGGRGTRLNGLFTPDPEIGIAKALLEIGVPKVKFVDHHIANLRQQNIQDIIISAEDQVAVYEYVQDMYGDDQDVSVTRSDRQICHGGSIVDYANKSNQARPILVQNVDTILDIDLQEFTRQFALKQKIGGVASIALTLNRGVPNEDAFAVDSQGKVVYSAEFKDEDIAPVKGNYRASSTGAVVIDPDFLRRQSWASNDGLLSLYRDCLHRAWEHDALYAYNNGQRFFRDIGTVATWMASDGDMELQSHLRYNKKHNV